MTTLNDYIALEADFKKAKEALAKIAEMWPGGGAHHAIELARDTLTEIDVNQQVTRND